MRKNLEQYSMVVCLVLLVTIGFVQYSLAAEIEVYFSPEDNPEEVIISCIDNAEMTLNIAMYYFTDREISQAVVRAHERGVKVRVYVDKSQVNAKYSSSRFLVKNRIPVRISSNDDLMHNKFAVIDTEIVLTGSYNWTASAAENDENLVVITDNEFARRYTEKFWKFICEKADWEKTVELYKKAGFFFIGSTESNKFHCPECKFARKILMDNEWWFRSAEEAVVAGYESCKVCKPPENCQK